MAEARPAGDLRTGPLNLLAHVDEARAVQLAALLTVVEATGIGSPETEDPPYARHAPREGLRCVGAWLDDRLVGFAYGASASRGSWWDTWVRGSMTAAGHADLLDGGFEVVAVHVDPVLHGRGVGRRLVTALLADLPHPRVLLTTQAGPNPARGFYRRLGLVELAEVDHEGVPYLVLAADLPLPTAERRA